MPSDEHVGELQQKLRKVSKKKCFEVLDIISLRHDVSTKTQELARIKEEIELLKIELQIQSDTINEAQKQLAVIELCKAYDKTKVDAYLKNMNSYKEQYQDLFVQEKEALANERKEHEWKQADNLDKKREQQMQIKKRNEEQMNEILIIEAECDDLEQECVVLKKRNTAIMLKLQRTLIEKEDARRNQFLIKRNR